MTYVYTPNRGYDRKWMWGSFGVAALFAFGAFMAWGHLAYDVVISCERASDSCEAVKHKNLGGNVTQFRLSEVKGAYVTVRRNSRGKVTTECTTFAIKQGAPLSFCGLQDDQVIDSFNAFLKDPAVARFDADLERTLFGYLVAWAAALLALVPLLFGMLMLWRLRRGTAYPRRKNRG